MISNPHRDRMRYFEELTHDEQVAAVKRMHAEGSSELAIAHASRWSLEYIHRVIGEPASREGRASDAEA